MAETLALAVGVPAVLAAAYLASRRSWSPAYADNRGIALQTVIIIVVLLVIAGSVAGVLIARGSDVVADLEAQDISRNVSSQAECQAAGRVIQGDGSTANAGTGASNNTTLDGIFWNANQCTINGGALTGGGLSASRCGSYVGPNGTPGAFTAGTATTTDQCVLA